MAHDMTGSSLQHLAEAIQKRMAGAQGIGYGLGLSIPGECRSIYAGEAVAGSGRRIGPASRFPIACLMKLFISIRCLQLVEAGRLALDARICDLAPGLRSGDARLDSMEVRHLLSHTSGYVEPRSEHRWTLSWDMFQAFFVTRRQAFRPGEVFSYSQTGHCILAHVIEQLDGASVFQSIEEHVLQPLGVSGSWLDSRSVDDVALHMHGAAGLTPFQSRQDKGILKASIGSRRLTLEDLLRVGEALVGRSHTGDSVVSAAMRAALFGEAIAIPLQTSRPGIEDLPVAYGLGLGRYRVGFGHNGSYVGAAIGLRVCPETKAVAVTALNTWSPVVRDTLMISALRSLARPPQPLARTPSAVEQSELAGRYQALMLGAGDIEITEAGEITQFGGMPASGLVTPQAGGGIAMTNNLPWAALAAFREAETGEVALLSMMSAYRKYPASPSVA